MAFKLMIMIAGMVSLTHAKPIMVSFGTRQGPILPPEPISTTLNPLAPRNPAPVHEQVDDIPNPYNSYRAPTPQQYRQQLLAHRPNPNLQIGTPLDIKYTPGREKEQLLRQKAQYAQSVGLNYQGPQVFNVQDYQLDQAKRNDATKTRTQHFVQQYQPRNQQQQQQPQQQQYNNNKNYQVNEAAQQQQQPYIFQYQSANQHNKFVPIIGVVYSSGIRYYVPQIVYNDDRNNNNENSVYDRNDIKYNQQQAKQQ